MRLDREACHAMANELRSLGFYGQLTWNPHKDFTEYCDDVSKFLEMHEALDSADVINADEIIESGECWELSFYPKTFVGSYCLVAPCLFDIVDTLRKGNYK